MCFAPQRRPSASTFRTSQPPKVVRTSGALCILTWKCASGHNGVHFFDLSASKSGPYIWCFVHFDLDMCFAPQEPALFWHLNFQKRSETVMFLHCWLEHVLPATTARTFSTWQWSVHLVSCTFWRGNVFRATTACKFSFLIWATGSAPAALASLLFDHQSHKSLEKHSESWISYLFAHLHLLSSHCFSSLLFSLLDFSFLTLPSSAFPSVHIVGSLTSKLPSVEPPAWLKLFEL